MSGRVVGVSWAVTISVLAGITCLLLLQLSYSLILRYHQIAMLTYRSVHMLCLLLVAMALRSAISFTTPAVLKKMFIDKTIATCTTLSQSYDDWDMEEESPDIDDMRDTLEISWNEKTMGTVRALNELPSLSLEFLLL